MLLKDKVAFVTGGSRGIGQAIVQCYLEEGAHVYYFSRNVSVSHEELVHIARAKGSSLTHIPGGVTYEEEVREAVQSAFKEAGSLDILVNNAGITRDKLFIAMKKEDWDEVIDVNLNGMFYTSKAVVPIMLKKKSGSIINISSIVGIIGNPGQVNYGASKAGIIGFSRSLALEIAKKNVRVNVIAPGFIGTDMTNAIKEEYKQKITTQIPMQMIGEPEDIGNACVFLGSHLSKYITGQTLTVSGGF